jgi:hypothetical protein
MIPPQVVGESGLIGGFTVNGHVEPGLFLFVIDTQRRNEADDLQ